METDKNWSSPRVDFGFGLWCQWVQYHSEKQIDKNLKYVHAIFPVILLLNQYAPALTHKQVKLLSTKIFFGGLFSDGQTQGGRLNIQKEGLSESWHSCLMEHSTTITEG